MHKKLIAAVVVAAFAAPFAAFADDATPAAKPDDTAAAKTTGPHTFTANVGLVNDYVFRGITQTNGNPAIQGGIDYTHSSGLYAGTWLSNISWYTDQNAGTRSAPTSLASPGSVGATYAANGSNQASLKMDFYGGYKGNFTDDWSYDVGLIRYQYPGTYDNLGGAFHNPNTTEAYAAIGYKWLTLKYSRSISSTTFGVNNSRGADYIDLSSTVPLGDSGFNLQAHVGHQRYPSKANTAFWGTSGGNNSDFSYTDYKIGVTKEYAGFVFGAAYTYANTKDTAPDGQTTAYLNAFGKNVGRSRGIVSVA